MNITYMIVRVNPASPSIEVQYAADGIPSAVVFNIDLRPVDGKLPVGQALDDIIRTFAPTDVFKRAIDSTSVDNLHEIEALIGVAVSYEYTPPTLVSNHMPITSL